MIFIFGFGEPKTYYIGPAEEQACAICKETRFHELIKITEWVSLFFIKIIPTKHMYYLVCPHCKNATEINKEAFEKKSPIATLNKAVHNGDLNKEEYDRLLKELENE